MATIAIEGRKLVTNTKKIGDLIIVIHSELWSIAPIDIASRMGTNFTIRCVKTSAAERLYKALISINVRKNELFR